MNPNTTTQSDEMARAALLPQSDASSLVDVEELDAKVKQMYGKVAREEQAELHFEIGRNLALHLGYPSELLDAIPADALASWRGGLRISEALALAETDVDQRRGSLLVRHGKGDKRREAGMDEWGFEQLNLWLEHRRRLPR